MPEHQDVRCPNCGGENFVFSEGDMVCTACGMVVDQQLIQEQSQQKATLWNYRGGASNGTSLTKKERAQLKLQRPYLNDGGRDKTEMGISRVIEKLGELMTLPTAVTGGAMKVSQKMLKSQREGKRTKLTVNDMSVLSVYSACRSYGMNRRLKDISLACKKMGLDYPPNRIFNKANKIDMELRPKASMEYLPTILSRVRDDRESRKVITRYLQVDEFISHLKEVSEQILKGSRVSGRNPWLVAVAAVCLADSFFRPEYGIVGRSRIVYLSDCGRSNLSELMASLKERAGLESMTSAHSQIFSAIRRSDKPRG